MSKPTNLTCSGTETFSLHTSPFQAHNSEDFDTDLIDLVMKNTGSVLK